MTRIDQPACMGVTANLVRALRDDERAYLAKERRAQTWRALLLALSVPFAFAASLAIGAVGVGMLPLALKPLGVAPVVAGLIGGAALALMALDLFRRRRRIALDLARGEVVGFQGHPRAAVSERTRIVLAREGFPVDGGLSVAFEVLRATGRLWSVGGARSHSWTLLPLQTPAAMPEHAARAAEWVKPVASMGGATILGRTRLLSDDERAEVAALERRLLYRRAREGLWVLITMAFVLPGALRARAPSLRGAGIVVCAFVVVAFGRKLAAGVRLVHRLARDRGDGLVQVVRRRAADEDVMSPATETLPRSGVAWSRGGEPAPWRRGSGGEIARG